jgi:hypothetical protein
MKFKVIICLLIIIACKDKNQPNFEISRTDSIKNTLIGKWGDESNCGWEITVDSFHNYEQDKSYPYKIAENDLVVDTGQSQFILKDVSVKEDTLFFLSRVSTEREIYGVVKAFRCK